ncbi:MAG: hypothetical protein AAF514_04915, partial [Verrucomicrobiota bacterium]
MMATRCHGPRPTFFSGLLAFTLSFARIVAAEEEAAPLPPDQLAFFENKIRPVLVEHCYGCHSAEAE